MLDKKKQDIKISHTFIVHKKYKNAKKIYNSINNEINKRKSYFKESIYTLYIILHGFQNHMSLTIIWTIVQLYYKQQFKSNT